MGAVAEAIDQALKGRDILRNNWPTSTRSNPFAATAWHLPITGWAWPCSRRGSSESARSVFHAAVLHQRLADEFPQQMEHQFGVATVFHNLGWLAESQGNRDEAEKKYRESIALLRSLLDDFPVASPTVCAE